MGHHEDIIQFSLDIAVQFKDQREGEGSGMHRGYAVELVSTKQAPYFIIIFPIMVMRKICLAISSRTSLLSWTYLCNFLRSPMYLCEYVTKIETDSGQECK